MSKKKTITASPAKAKAEGLQLPLNTPVVSQAPAKPVHLPVEPAAVVKKAVRKTAATDAKSEPQAQLNTPVVVQAPAKPARLPVEPT